MKKVLVTIIILLIGISIWYIFIKKEDYQVTFQVKTTPQNVYDHILKSNIWGKGKTRNIKNIDSILYEEAVQQVTLEDTTLLLSWKVKELNDSITKVKVGINSGNHSIANKLEILTGATPFTQSIISELKQFRKSIHRFVENYEIKIDGITTTPKMDYLYVSHITARPEKAKNMIRSNTEIYPKISKYTEKENGHPFIKIQSWDTATDVIQFDFGFPVKRKDSLPTSANIKLGNMQPFKALKATYYGNYAYSDQAWFALENYAKANNITIKNEPLEIFYDDPGQGGNEKEWKTEIFMPIMD